MKLRIKGNSVRLRLGRSEVERLINEGNIKEYTQFGKSIFSYSISLSESDEMNATFSDNCITVMLPESYARGWNENEEVGFRGSVNGLMLVVEKDFVCLDETSEDQTDNYDNPKAAC